MKKVLFLLIAVFVYLFCAHHIFAATITMSNGLSKINSEDEYSVSVHVSINASDGKVYYLRGVFHTQGSSNYCGYTWNGYAWYNSPIETGNNFFPITILNNSWDGVLKAKIDSSDNGCADSGLYYFKIFRYTGSSSSANDETTTELQVDINIPAPMPSPTNTPVPTHTPTPSPTSKPSPTNTPTPTPKPPATPTPMKTMATSTQKPTFSSSNIDISPIPVASDNSSALEGASDGAMLAQGQVPSDTPVPTTAVLGIQSKPSPTFSIAFFGIGGILFALCGILLFRQYKIRK